MNISTKANTHIKLKRLVESSTLYLIWASIAAVVAIVLNRPAQFGGSTSGLPVVQDFIHGTGTALSPPLVWMLAQALLTWLAWNQMNRKSTWGVIGLALFDATVFVGVLGEPITYELLNPVTFNPLLVVIQAGMIIIPLAMMVFAIQEWRRRWSENQAEESGLIGDLRGCGVRRPRSFLADSCRGSATFGALKAAGMSVDESAEVVADFLDHQAGGDHR